MHVTVEFGTFSLREQEYKNSVPWGIGLDEQSIKRNCAQSVQVLLSFEAAPINANRQVEFQQALQIFGRPIEAVNDALLKAVAMALLMRLKVFSMNLTP